MVRLISSLIHGSRVMAEIKMVEFSHFPIFTIWWSKSSGLKKERYSTTNEVFLGDPLPLLLGLFEIFDFSTST